MSKWIVRMRRDQQGRELREYLKNDTPHGDGFGFWTVVILVAAVALVAIGALSGVVFEPLAPDAGLIQ